MAATSRLHRAFCDNVRARRLQLELTQSEVAERLGITQASYSFIESGRRVPGLDLVERVATALKIPAALLLTNQEPVEVS